MTFLKVSSRNTQKIEEHRARCKVEQIPYVICKTRTKLADVEYDHITFDPKYDHLFQIHESSLREKIMEIYWRYEVTKRSGVSAGVGELRNLKIQDAEAVAAEIYALVSELIQNADRH